MRQFDTRIIVNVIGKTVEEYAAVVERIEAQEGADAYEINISCPNIKEGGISFGSDPAMAARGGESCPLPDSPAGDCQALAQRDRRDRGRTGVPARGRRRLSLVNTFLAMAIDVESERPVLANVFGGLSGPPDPAYCGADGMGGVPRGGPAAHRDGWHYLRPGRSGVYPCRCLGRRRGNSELYQPFRRAWRCSPESKRPSAGGALTAR